MDLEEFIIGDRRNTLGISGAEGRFKHRPALLNEEGFAAWAELNFEWIYWTLHAAVILLVEEVNLGSVTAGRELADVGQNGSHGVNDLIIAPAGEL